MSGTVFIGMETSGALRTRFQQLGFFTVSADVLPAEDGAEFDSAGLGGHIQGDVWETLEFLWAINRWPSLGVFHITCTNLTGSAEWAYKDPDYDRYPGVGYHQKLKPGTPFGAERRALRETAKDEFRRVRSLKIPRKVVENPVGALSQIMKPTQIVQPYEFGDDASKKTCLWLMDENGDHAREMMLPIDPAKRCPGRMVNVTNHGSERELDLGYVTQVERWANQTDSGQNRLTPGDERWKDRSRTYPGIADAAAEHWSNFVFETRIAA